MNFENIGAITRKEWQLNLRFAFQYLVHHLIAPCRTAILMLVLYRGLLPGQATSMGMLKSENYVLFVLLGTLSHAVFTNSCSVIIAKMQQEKWWQTIVALLISPATPVESAFGILLGGAGIYVIMCTVSLAILAVIFKFSFLSFFLGVATICLLSIYAAGMGIVGGVVALCFEGKSFIFEYTTQAIIFLSCFYYPLEILPTVIRPFAVYLPTYQISQLLKEIFLTGYSVQWGFRFAMLALAAIPTLLIPTYGVDYCLRRFGIVGY